MNEVDLQYNTASLRAYAANVAAFFQELVHSGMSRKEALAVTIEMVRQQVRNAKDDES